MGDPVVAGFLAMFEALRMPATFAQGRRAARAGHVRQLSISTSLVVAHVRGPEDPTAHRARIAVRAFGAAEWARVEDRLAARARHLAELLAGRMPQDVAAVFDAAGLHLLPLSLDEVALDCTCQRWPMPCAHLAATCYALARDLETDPFGAFAWRGRSRDELLAHLQASRAYRPELPTPVDDAGLGDPADFWGTRPPAAARAPTVGTAPPPDALLDHVDPPRLRYDGRDLAELLRPAYRAFGLSRPDGAGTPGGDGDGDGDGDVR